MELAMKLVRRDNRGHTRRETYVSVMYVLLNYIMYCARYGC